jgi:hypothetical protein
MAGQDRQDSDLVAEHAAGLAATVIGSETARETGLLRSTR